MDVLAHRSNIAKAARPTEHVLAWTEQHPAVLHRLRDTGEFHADGRRVPKQVRGAFGWMRRKMADCAVDARGRPLIWLNVVPDFQRRELCDWRCTRRNGRLCTKVHITPGKDWIRLSIPADRLLLSDFESWSRYVMAYQYVPVDDADAVRWERELRRELRTPRDVPTPHPFDAASDATLRRVIASWDRIFDVDMASGRTVQATVEQLFVADVVDVLPAPDLDDVPQLYRVNVSTYLRGDE